MYYISYFPVPATGYSVSYIYCLVKTARLFMLNTVPLSSFNIFFVFPLSSRPGVIKNEAFSSIIKLWILTQLSYLINQNKLANFYRENAK